MTELKLIAFDAEDLAILSAHLQDAVVKVGDMAFRPREKRFAALVNRFDWETATADPGGRRAKYQRRRTALRFERVLKAQLTGVDLKARSQVLSLLAIQFAPSLEPGGTITLLFAGGAAIRLEVECIEGEMKDLGAAWRARAKPDHPDSEQE